MCLVGNLPTTKPDNEMWEKILEYRIYRDVIIKYTLIYFNEIERVEEHSSYFEKNDPLTHSMNGQVLEEFASTVISYMSSISKELKEV